MSSILFNGVCIVALCVLSAAGCESTSVLTPGGKSASSSAKQSSKASSASKPARVKAQPAAAGSAAPQAGREAPAAKQPAQTAQAGQAALPKQVEIVPPNGEVCDGKDNDDNGLIDDADVEGDGVCDCLKIASIGRPGAYGKGDLQFQTWPNPMAQHHVVALAGAELTAERLAAFDVVIVLNVSTHVGVAGEKAHHAFSDSEVAAFEGWVRAGGGVLTTSGYSGELDKDLVNVNKLLAPFKLGYSATKYGLDGIVSKWTAHPLTAGVKRVYVEAGAEPDGSEALTLARDASERVALQVPKTDSARILVWGDEWITYASQWKVERDQQVERFWLNALDWLSRESSCQHRI